MSKVSKKISQRQSKKKVQEVFLEKILVVYNKPLYQQLIIEEKHPYYLRLLKKHAEVTRNWKKVYEEHQRSLDGVESTLKLLGLKTDFLYRKDLSSQFGKKHSEKISAYDLVVTVGGDGTFLETSHFITKSVLLGVNGAPSESTGALCAARIENFLTTVVDFMTGVLKPTTVPRLKVKIGQKTLPRFALNEVLFANCSPGGTSRYLIRVGKTQEEHKSSGIWMATGVGSTAAIHSAGGKKLPPDFQGFQYQVRELLKLPGQRFHLSNGLLKKNQAITLIPTSRQMALFMDGNHLETPVEYGEKVMVSVGGDNLRVLF